MLTCLSQILAISTVQSETIRRLLFCPRQMLSVIPSSKPSLSNAKHTNTTNCPHFFEMSCSKATPQSTWLTYPDKFFRVTTPLADDGGGRDVEKGGVALCGHGLGQKGLPCARWTIQQDSFPWRQDALEQLRVLDRHAHFERQGLGTAEVLDRHTHILRDKTLEQLRVLDRRTHYETRPWNSWV